MCSFCLKKKNPKTTGFFFPVFHLLSLQVCALYGSGGRACHPLIGRFDPQLWLHGDMSLDKILKLSPPHEQLSPRHGSLSVYVSGMCYRVLESGKVLDKAVLILCNSFETTGYWLYLNRHFMQGALEFLPVTLMARSKNPRWPSWAIKPKLMIRPITIALIMEV